MLGRQMDEASRREAIDLLPVGVVHIDEVGTITVVNSLFADLLGLPREEILGRNLLEFGAGDPTRSLELMAFSPRVRSTLLGPVAASYHGPDGTIRRTNLWARNFMDDPEVKAMVCVFTPEEARDRTAEALASIVSGSDVDHTLRLLASAVRGHPFDCAGTWLLREDGDQRLIADDLLAPQITAALAGNGPWWEALTDRTLHECCDTGTDPGSASLAPLGVAAWWLLPVTGLQGIEAGLLVLRRLTGPPSPNQTEHLQEITTIARLAIDQLRLRAFLAHAAFHDPLTGLANRGQFFGRDELTPGSGVAVLTIDLDRFKPVNDLLGHRAGDQVLVTVAERIRHAVRPGDHVARLGGDEFAVECATVATPREATEIAQRIVNAIGEPMDVEGVQVTVGASVGVAWAEHDRNRAELLERSDQALMVAKRTGRGRWHLDGDPEIAG